jgi:ABC-type multidrug transport system ATPase subunit
MLTVNRLTFAYGPRAVFEDVSLSLPRGGILAVAGGSGAGKTTLLKCLLLLFRSVKGELTYFGNEFRFSDDAEPSEQDDPSWTLKRLQALRARIGYVPQNSVLFPSMTLSDNVRLPLRLLHGSVGDADMRARVALHRFGIEDLADAKPWRVSGGQLQRAAIARAFAGRPDLFLMDEPTGALDAANVRLVGEQLRHEVSSRGCSALIVTHNLGFARAYCDDLAVLRGGTLTAPVPVQHVNWEAAIEELL